MYRTIDINNNTLETWDDDKKKVQPLHDYYRIQRLNNNNQVTEEYTSMHDLFDIPF